MPQLRPSDASPADDPPPPADVDIQDSSVGKGPTVWERTWHTVENWLGNNGAPAKNAEEETEMKAPEVQEAGGGEELPVHVCDEGEREALKKNPDRRAIAGLPREPTFRRVNSELRERLIPHEPDRDEKAAEAAERMKTTAGNSPVATPPQPNLSTQTTAGIAEQPATAPGGDQSVGGGQEGYQNPPPGQHPIDDNLLHALDNFAGQNGDLPPPGLSRQGVCGMSETPSEPAIDRAALLRELEERWILNLSMLFKDRTDREKFFITFAQAPNKWLRVTISCDYRNKAPDTLEAELKSLHYQRDKSMRIYEAIRESLADIMFYQTVTNLKLESIEGRLHIHVTEDKYETIPYPREVLASKIRCRRYKESEIAFDAHLSGFVYRVRVGGRILVKKEIPGPEAVNEFLYEMHALDALQGAPNVIQFEGLVVDESGTLLKGLLIAYAPRGALVDILYDARYLAEHALHGAARPAGALRPLDLRWKVRERWARQIVAGLAEIHDAGYVQGDFTLANVVISAAEDAYIVDFNRRGCPVGWEPPELESKIQHGNQIKMLIGVKTDLWQLGMILWGLAMAVEEPEREEFRDGIDKEDVPEWFKRVVDVCLSEDPRHRIQAREVLNMFPPSGQPGGEEDGEEQMAQRAGERDMGRTDFGIVAPGTTAPELATMTNPVPGTVEGMSGAEQPMEEEIVLEGSNLPPVFHEPELIQYNNLLLVPELVGWSEESDATGHNTEIGAIKSYKSPGSQDHIPPMGSTLQENERPALPKEKETEPPQPQAPSPFEEEEKDLTSLPTSNSNPPVPTPLPAPDESNDLPTSAPNYILVPHATPKPHPDLAPLPLLHPHPEHLAGPTPQASSENENPSPPPRPSSPPPPPPPPSLSPQPPPSSSPLRDPGAGEMPPPPSPQLQAQPRCRREEDGPQMGFARPQHVDSGFYDAPAGVGVEREEKGVGGGDDDDDDDEKV